MERADLKLAIPAIAFGAVNLAQAAAVTGALPIANGGTGATDATAALVALGAAEAAHAIARTDTPIAFFTVFDMQSSHGC